jgi:hypothetical protein
MAFMRKPSQWHIRGMSSREIDNPILNSSFADASRRGELDEQGIPIGTPAPCRRRSEFIVPAPRPKHKVKAQAALDLDRDHRTETVLVVRVS